MLRIRPDLELDRRIATLAPWVAELLAARAALLGRRWQAQFGLPAAS